MDDLPGIDAVVLFIQGGEEGGNALADVLSGKVNFSGKLTDTIPLHYEDIPFGDQFSYLNGNLDNEYYNEDIYVGYRYFDTFNKQVRYPFGFGLSYTSFTIESRAAIQKMAVEIRATVHNTGAYSGKEVVQIYISAPAGVRAKEYQRLVAFAKTKELAPDESQELLLVFDMADCAGYEERSARWQLDAGRYLVRVGNSSRNTQIAAAVVLDETITICQCKNCCKPTDDLPTFDWIFTVQRAKQQRHCYIRILVILSFLMARPE